MKKINGYVLLILFICGLIYIHWITFSNFTYGDWPFYFKQTLLDRFYPTIWNSIESFNFGAIDIVVWRLPIYLINAAFGTLGFDYNVAEKFVVFWPIVFGLSVSSFFLVKHIVKSDLAAFMGSLVFSFSTYFLSINSQGHELLPAAFVFSTLSILIYIKLFEQKKIHMAFITGILLFISGAYDLRSAYIVLGISFLYFIYELFINFAVYKKEIFKNIFLFLLPFFIYFALSAYWIIPLLSTGYISKGYALGRQIFGNEFYNIQASITSFFPFWTGEAASWFTIQKIHLIFWAYPILAILGLLFNRKNKYIIFFGLVAIIGIFFSKQADYPFSQIYNWAYVNFPGFDAFRESSKFDFMISLGFAVLIGGFIKWLLDKRFSLKNLQKYKVLLILILAVIFLWNGKPILTGEIGGLYVPHKLPTEFIRVKDLIFEQPDYFRTFWINMSLQWTMSDNLHPEIEGVVTFNNDWHKFIISESAERKDSEGKRMIKALGSSTVQKLLELSSVKYVIVPLQDKETSSDIVKGFGETHEFYIKELSKINYLKKVDIGTKDILVYENLSFRPHIYITSEEESLNKNIAYKSVDYKFITPSEYKISLKNVKKPVWLNFSENYHPAWNIRVGEFNWLNVIFNKNYFIDNSFHKNNEINFNSFYVNPQNVCSLYSCKKNSDGSYNIELTLYLKTQSKLYLGMLISGLMLFMSIAYLIYYGAKKYKLKK